MMSILTEDSMPISVRSSKPMEEVYPYNIEVSTPSVESFSNVSNFEHHLLSSRSTGGDESSGKPNKEKRCGIFTICPPD